MTRFGPIAPGACVRDPAPYAGKCTHAWRDLEQMTGGNLRQACDACGAECLRGRDLKIWKFTAPGASQTTK